MKKNNVGKSDDVQDAVSDEESYIDYAKRLAKTFNFSSSSSQHICTVDGKVTSSSINNNNPKLHLEVVEKKQKMKLTLS